jgi:predicted DNA-binding transcriptional regulator AlpA
MDNPTRAGPMPHGTTTGNGASQGNPEATHGTYSRSPDSLLDRRAVCELFGGTKPINPSTLYRGIKAGRYPPPVKVGPGSSRWLRAECEAVLRSMVEARR